MQDGCYLGIDIGGTRLRMATVTADGRVEGEIVVAATGREFDRDRLAAALREQRAQAAAGAPALVGVGVGVACVVRHGRPLSHCDNLPLLNELDLSAAVKQVLGLPVSIENDARCFALAEARFGAARGSSHVVGLTLGTGVGCGLVLEGRLHRGEHGEAGEACRIPLRGHPVEHHVSGAGVVRAYHAAGGRPELRDAAAVAEAARAGDGAARRAWQSFGEDLGFLCQCIASIVDPECVVLGGSMARARDLFESILQQRLVGWPMRIAYSRLESAAGVIGAAALCMP